VHIKRSHRDEDMLADGIAQATRDKRITSYFTNRFLEYLRWLEDGSGNNLIVYYALRITAIVLAALVPALVALDLGSVGRTVTVVLGVIVAAATAVEHFLTSGQRWRHYRGSVELMKSEGWLYLELAGPYSNLGSLEAAFPTFVERVETLMRDEVKEYVTTIVVEREPTTTQDDSGDQPAPK
jgi:hypothetical protein